jgi:hypothetical protein
MCFQVFKCKNTIKNKNKNIVTCLFRTKPELLKWAKKMKNTLLARLDYIYCSQYEVGSNYLIRN